MQGHSAKLRRCLGIIAGGVVFAVVAIVVQWNGPQEGVVHDAFDVLNYPVYVAFDWIADTWYHGSADQFIPQGVILWMAYWLLLAIGLSVLVTWGFGALSHGRLSLRHRRGEG